MAKVTDAKDSGTFQGSQAALPDFSRPPSIIGASPKFSSPNPYSVNLGQLSGMNYAGPQFTFDSIRMEPESKGQTYTDAAKPSGTNASSSSNNAVRRFTRPPVSGGIGGMPIWSPGSSPFTAGGLIKNLTK